MAETKKKFFKQSTTRYRLNPLQHWLMCHFRALVFGLGELIRTPFASFLTILVIGIAMALPSGLFVLLQNVQRINNFWNGTPSISLYLKKDLSDSDLADLTQTLRNNSSIASTRYISPSEGLKEFEANTQFNSLLNSLTKNPLPGVMIVIPKPEFQTPKNLKTLLSHLQRLSQIEVGQLDMAWVQRLYSLVVLGKRITYSVGLLFSIGVLLIIGNTLRLIMQNHREETLVLKLVGATRGFIRRPLLYRGFLYGFFGGVTAWILILVTLKWLEAPAQTFAKTYNNLLLFHGLGFQSDFIIIGFCSLLGWLGAWFSVRQFLNAREE